MKQVSDETLREQLALFEVFTMGNIYKEAGHKVAKQCVKAINVVTELINKEPLQGPEGFSIDEALETNKLARKEQTRECLYVDLKSILVERCAEEKDVSEEALSITIINEAAEVYSLKEALLPAQKADWIAKYYKDELANGEDVYTLLRMKMPQGRNRMLRYLFIQLIDICVEACDGQMTTKDEELPSFRVAEEKQKDMHEELSQELAKNEETYSIFIEKLFQNNQMIGVKNKFIEEEENKQDELKAHIHKLEEELQQETREKEKLIKYAKMKSYKNMIEMSEEECKSAIFYRDRWQVISKDLSKEVEKVLKAKETASKALQEIEEARHQAREKSWESAYSEFNFEPHCLENIRQTFTEEDIRDCERALMELSKATDKQALSWGAVKEAANHFLFSFQHNERGIVIYDIVEDKAYKVNIVQIAKILD